MSMEQKELLSKDPIARFIYNNIINKPKPNRRFLLKFNIYENLPKKWDAPKGMWRDGVLILGRIVLLRFTINHSTHTITKYKLSWKNQLTGQK